MKHTHAKLLALCLLALFCLTACAEADDSDFAAKASLNRYSETAKQEVTVHTFVDGDTVHFNVPETVVSTGVLKARFLAVNTPESTGKIEEYGKAASAFTRGKLESAESIIIESDSAGWNLDSTGGRHLVWVWYKPTGESAYRNLNIELLQNGLAIANSSANNRYGSICMAAIQYAKEQKKGVYSGQKDPDFYYGDAVELTLRELRLNPEAYNGIKVAFSGVITMNSNNGVYMESYDAETDLYYGMYVYYGFNMSGAGLQILTVGNEARIVGTLQYYEAGGSWQVSGLTYRMMRPTDPGNIQKLSDGHAPAYKATDPAVFALGKVEIPSENGASIHDYASLAMNTSVEITSLTVVGAAATLDKSSSSYGAITLSCEANGAPVTVRTIPLYGADGKLLSPDAFTGKTITVRGIVDSFNGEYQIKVFMADAITIE